ISTGTLRTTGLRIFLTVQGLKMYWTLLLMAHTEMPTEKRLTAHWVTRITTQILMNRLAAEDSAASAKGGGAKWAASEQLSLSSLHHQRRPKRQPKLACFISPFGAGLMTGV